MSVHSLLYSLDGEQFRVLIVNDVIALPYNYWSQAGYGHEISVEWLLHNGKLPGQTKARRQLLAELIRKALADVHGYTVKDCRTFRQVERFSLPGSVRPLRALVRLERADEVVSESTEDLISHAERRIVELLARVRSAPHSLGAYCVISDFSGGQSYGEQVDADLALLELWHVALAQARGTRP